MTSHNSIGKLIIGGLAALGFGAIFISKYKKKQHSKTAQAAKILSTSTLTDTPKMNAVVNIIGTAVTFRRKAEYDKAIAAIEEISNKFSSNLEVMAWAAIEKGLSLIQKGDFTQAESTLKYAQTLKYHDTTGQLGYSIDYELAKVYARTNRVDDAITLIKSAISQIPDNTKASIRREQMRSREGQFYNGKNDFTTAKSVLTNVLENQIKLYGTEMDGEILITMIHLTEAYIGLGEDKNAHTLIERAKTVHARNNNKELNPEILFLSGLLCKNTDSAKAKECFQEALKIEEKKRPNGPLANKLRAEIAKLS